MTLMPRVGSARGTLVLALGSATMASALAAAAFLMTYEGVGLIGYRTAISAGTSAILLIATLVCFKLSGGKDTPPRAALGLTLAIAAYPMTFLVAMGTYAITGALGIYW